MLFDAINRRVDLYRTKVCLYLRLELVFLKTKGKSKIKVIQVLERLIDCCF